MNAVVLFQPALKPNYMIGNKQNKGFTPTPKFGVSLQSKRGFTLVELLVAFMVFTLAVAAATALFASVLKSQRKSIAIQNAQDNARYLIGFLAKEIRMSEIRSDDGEFLILDVYHPDEEDIRYQFSGGEILRNGEKINSDEVQVDGRFFIDGTGVGDGEQPRVTMVIKVETTGAKAEERAKVNLQTTLSQRGF